jgi:cobalt/nickel transport system permease protein
MPADFLDRYSRGTTICHRLSARLKVVLTLAVIMLAMLLPSSLWPAEGCLLCLVFAAHTLAGIPLAYLVRRVMLILPLVVMTALAIPLSHGFQGGWETAFGVVMRSAVAFLAALWLVSTTPFERLLAAVCRLGMPRVFAALLAFVYRYVYVLFDELARMRTAQRARTFGSRVSRTRWTGAVQLVGTLIVRAIDRAERIHGAMSSRGWTGNFTTLD